MLADLAQRMRFTRTSSMHGRSQLLDQAARGFDVSGTSSCISFLIRTDRAHCGRPFLGDAAVLRSTRCIVGSLAFNECDDSLGDLVGCRRGAHRGSLLPFFLGPCQQASAFRSSSTPCRCRRRGSDFRAATS